jgi:hypothetical protein
MPAGAAQEGQAGGGVASLALDQVLRNVRLAEEALLSHQMSDADKQRSYIPLAAGRPEEWGAHAIDRMLVTLAGLLQVDWGWGGVRICVGCCAAAAAVQQSLPAPAACCWHRQGPATAGRPRCWARALQDVAADEADHPGLLGVVDECIELMASELRHLGLTDKMPPLLAARLRQAGEHSARGCTGGEPLLLLLLLLLLQDAPCAGHQAVGTDGPRHSRGGCSNAPRLPLLGALPRHCSRSPAAPGRALSAPVPDGRRLRAADLPPWLHPLPQPHIMEAALGGGSLSRRAGAAVHMVQHLPERMRQRLRGQGQGGGSPEPVATPPRRAGPPLPLGPYIVQVKQEGMQVRGLQGCLRAACAAAAGGRAAGPRQAAPPASGRRPGARCLAVWCPLPVTWPSEAACIRR